MKFLASIISVMAATSATFVVSAAAREGEAHSRGSSSSPPNDIGRNVVEKVPSYNEDTNQLMDKMAGSMVHNLDKADEKFVKGNVLSSEKPVTSSNKNAIEPFTMEGMEELSALTHRLLGNEEQLDAVPKFKPRSLMAWQSQFKLLVDDGALGDQFGRSVAVSGDIAVVGAPYDDDKGFGSGSAYIYTRNADNTWTQQAKLVANDGAASDNFGRSVAVSGDIAVVGAPYDDDKGSGSGSAYVLIRNADNTWTQQAKLVADDGALGDNFGWSVAVSGDTVVVGAQNDDDKGSSSGSAYSGSAYIFIRNADNTWTQQAKLLANDGAENDNFGLSVAVSGDTVVVGAQYDDDKGSSSGSAYIYTRNADNTWTQQAKLLANDGAASDNFGRSVAVSGDIAVVGAPYDDDKGSGSGSAYVLIRNADNTWTQQAKLVADDGALGDNFGWSVAVSGDTVVVGAQNDDDKGSSSGSAYSGSAYIFIRNADNTWTQQAKLVADDGVEGDLFGYSVAVSGDTVVVSAYGDDDKGANSGSAYVFIRNADNAWIQTKLLANDGAENDNFGLSVAVSEDTVVVGAKNNDAKGSAYAFSFLNAPTTWDLTFLDMVANFTPDSVEELTFTYKVGAGRAIAHSLEAGGCETPVAITNLTLGQDYNVTASTTNHEDPGYDTLQLDYSFDKKKISTSAIWDSVENKIEACQTVQLTLDDGNNGTMVISELKSNVTVDFDLSANFSVANGVDLDGATILANNDTTTLDDYITAYKCEDIDTKSEGDKLMLVPNDELKVCIESTSTDVQIASIDSMKIDGTKPLPEGGASSLDVFNEDGTPKFSAITTFVIENNRLNANPVAMITTRVPPNLFDFEATNAKIDVSGSITVKLAGGTRKLLLGGPDRLLQAGTDNLFDTNNGGEAGFDVIIDLESEDTDEFEGAMMNSGKAFANKVVAIIGMAIATTYTLW